MEEMKCVKHEVEVPCYVVRHPNVAMVEERRKVDICQHQFVTRPLGVGKQNGDVLPSAIGVDYGVPGAAENHPTPLD